MFNAVYFNKSLLALTYIKAQHKKATAQIKHFCLTFVKKLDNSHVRCTASTSWINSR